MALGESEIVVSHTISYLISCAYRVVYNDFNHTRIDCVTDISFLYGKGIIIAQRSVIFRARSVTLGLSQRVRS